MDSNPAASLFDDLDLPHSSDRLVLLPSRPGCPLSKAQKTFNRLIARVETLRARLEATRQQLDEALRFHAEHLRPFEERLHDRRKGAVRALRPYLDDRRLKRRDQTSLADFVSMLLDEIVGREDSPDDDLRALFQRLNGVDLAQAQQCELDEARAAMESIFADMGITMDMSEFRPGMSEEDLAARTAQMADDVRRQAEQAQSRRRGRRRKTKRDLADERRLDRMAEARRTSIGAIYRRLAKVLHPDLEPDPERKARKGETMQELTSAYARNDLHTLLRLELEWIHGEQRHLDSLTDERLDACNQVLKEQAAELEETIAQLSLHPRYSDLAEPFGAFGTRMRLNGPAELRQLQDLSEALELLLSRLASGHALASVREIARVHRSSLESGRLGPPF